MGFVLNKNGSYRKLFFKEFAEFPEIPIYLGAGQPQPFVLYSFLRG